MRFTVPLFLVAFLTALFAMPTNVVKACYGGFGIEHAQPWRRSSMLAAAFVRRGLTKLRDILTAMWSSTWREPALALTATLIALLVLPTSAHAFGIAAVVPFNIRALEQAKFDNEAKQAALKAEARGIPMATKDRSAEQNTRLDAIDAELKTLATELAATAGDLARAQGYQADERAEAAALAARIQMGKNRAEDKPITLGQFLQGLAYSAAPSLAAAAGFVMTDEIRAAVSGASSGDAASGGVLVRNEWSTDLLNKAREASQLLPKCDNKPIGDGFDGLEAPYIDETSRATGSRWGGVQVYRAAEAASVTNKQPKLGKFELRLEDMKGLFYATDRLLRDATALQAIAEDGFSSEFAFKIDDEIVRGTGTGQCLGILNAGNKVKVSKETAQTADTVKAENVIKMFSRMPARFMAGAEWFINQEILPQLMTMSVAVGTAGGQLVYMPPGGLSSAPFGTLMGRPVNPIEQASGIGDEGDIMLLNLKEYVVISKPMTSASSMHVRFIYDEMTFRWTWPIIGKPKSPAALTPYKATTATSLSPFVTLEAR